ncbi:MAG: hypothetical protein RLZZ182_2258 [Pseudomonadota bacterium]|jgi:hypothetical protein
MTPVRTANPCPSKEKKKPKAQFIVTILVALGRIYRALKLVDAIWEWLKGHLGPVVEWIKSLGDFL